MGQPVRQQARDLAVAIAERDDKVDVVEKFINLTIADTRRDLAEKVLAAIDDAALRTLRGAPQVTNDAIKTRNVIRAAVSRVFVECGVGSGEQE